ncbi:neogenin-like isoform X2 [Corticium candelabrum]|uniref:neogenin-like isoform X2 n=1 Tax=Corticium candelabrum TaxID=121492 RepID=UPI002E2599A4|nr:neogenin-like isoform X2 [Corticium candelabrum]
MRWTDVIVGACFLYLAGAQFYQLLSSPGLEEEPKSVIVKRGRNVSFKCRSNGDVQWFRNDQKLWREDGYEMLENGDLLISNVDRNHEGKYYCMVSVDHVGAVRSRTAELKLRNTDNQWLIPPSNITVYEGNAAYFYCLPNFTISRRGLITIMPNSTSHVYCGHGLGTWNRDRCQLQDSEQFHFLSDGSLLVRNVSSSKNKYEFCCTVTTRYKRKRIRGSTNYIVKRRGIGPKCAYLTVKQSSGVKRALNISVTPRNISVHARSDIFIPCIATGVPSPEVVWTNPDGNEVHVNGLAKGRLEVIEPGVLKIRESRPSDSGVYRCVARNKHGQKKEVTATVVVSNIPKVKSKFNNTIWILRSKAAELHCPIIAQNYHPVASPKITWLVNGTVIQKSLDSQKSKFLLLYDKLHITNVEFSDEGMYQCVVENALGSAQTQTSFRVRTIGPPDAVKNLKFNNVPGDVVLSWSPGYPGCQTATCSIQSYVVEVLKRGRCTGKCSHRIEGHRTSVQLISGGMVDSSDEYQIRVSACSALNECGRPVSRSRLIVVSDKKSNDIRIYTSLATAVNISYQLHVPSHMSFVDNSCKVCVYYTGSLSPPLEFHEWQTKCHKCRTHLPLERQTVEEIVKINDLKPWTEYQVFLKVYGMGMGMTREDFVATSHIAHYHTAMAAPSRAPLLQQAIRLNSTTIKLIFKGIGSNDVRSPSFYYQLNQIEQNQTNVVCKLPMQNRSDADNETISVLIDGSLYGLSPWYDYKLTVQSCCDASKCREWATKADGTFIESIELSRLEALCSMSCTCSEYSVPVVVEPSEIKFESVTNTTIIVSGLSAKVSWEPINSSLIWGYKVNISMESDKQDPYIDNDTTASQLNVTGLRQQSHYKVTVSIWTFDRPTPIKCSQPVTFVTPPELWAPPNYVVVKHGNRMNSVVVSWESSLHSNVTGYMVSYCNSSQQFPISKTNATTNSSIINDLLPNKTYLMKVATMYNGQQGLWSSTCVSYRTSDFVPPPEIRRICIGTDHVQLTVLPCSSPSCQYRSLNISICPSSQSNCFFYNTTFQDMTQSGSSITFFVKTSKSWRARNYSVSLQYANYEGTKPTVWSDSIPVSGDSCLGVQSQNTAGTSGVVSVISVVGVVAAVLILGVVAYYVRLRVQNKSSRVATKKHKFSTTSSVGPVDKQAAIYTEPDTVVDGQDTDSEGYDTLEEGAQKCEQSDQNRLHNQGDEYSPGHILGLYLGQPPREELVAKKGYRRCWGRRKVHKQDNGMRSQAGDIPLDPLRHPNQNPVNVDKRILDSGSPGTRGRRIGVTVQPEINHIPSPSTQDNSHTNTTADKTSRASKGYMQLDELVTPLGNYKQPEEHHKESQENTDEMSLTENSQITTYCKSHDRLSDTDTSSIDSQLVGCKDQHQLSQNQIAQSDKEFQDMPRPQTKTLHSNYVSRQSIGSLAEDAILSPYLLSQHQKVYTNPTGTSVSRNSTGALSQDMGIASYSPPRRHKSQSDITCDYSSGSSVSRLSVDMGIASYSPPQHHSKSHTTTAGDYVSKLPSGDISGILSHSFPHHPKSQTGIIDRLSVEMGISSHSPLQHHHKPYVTATGDYIARHSSDELSDDMGIASYSPPRHHKSLTDITQIDGSQRNTKPTSLTTGQFSSLLALHHKPHASPACDYMSRTVVGSSEDTKEYAPYSPL